LAVIQVASRNKIYLFDCFKINSPLIGNYFKDYFNGDGIKLGHAVCQDLRAICTQLHIPKSVERVIDTWHIFKGLFPEEKFSNLSHICKRLIGKEICKVQTLSDWRRRPLRLNQKHYAAMDAFIVVKIYDKLLSEYGEQYISHFV
jgi:ribonuclease D